MSPSPSQYHRFAGRIRGALLACALALPASAEDQTATRSQKWTFEIYGGGAPAAFASTGASRAAFPVGSSFTLASGQPSRAVSSWYFGDGAALLNQVLTQFSASAGSTFPRIVPMDAALTADAARRAGGLVFGARLGRSFTSRLAFELDLERGLASSALDDSVRTGLQSSSDSFSAAFRGLLNSAPVTSVAVSSTLTVPDVTNHQTRVAFVLRLTVLKGNRVSAHLVGGGGFVSNGGKTPEATLLGRYGFRLFGSFPMDETDSVVLRITQPKGAAMGVFGAGLTFDLSSRSGLRADVRLQMNSNGDTSVLTSAPAIAPQSLVSVLPTSATTSPGLQFSTQPGVRSTLGGPGASVTLFSGSGLNSQASFTIALFRRF